MRLRRTSLFLALLIAGAACNAPGLITPTTAPTHAGAATAVPAEPSATVADLATPSPQPATATSEPRRLRIAYIVDGNVWGVELGSAPAQLTASGAAIDLRISDDGQRIAYLAFHNLVELRSIRFDGSDDRSLLDQAAFDALYPLEVFQHYAPSQIEMAPGSHNLLLNTRGVFEGPGLAKNDDLLRVNADTGELVAVLPRGDGGDFTLSPDGSQLAIVRPDSIGFANQDGSRLLPEVLSFTPVITYSDYLYYPLPVWVEGGVAAAIPSEDPFFAPVSGRFWQVPSDGSDPVLLAELDADLFGPQSGAALVAPDGTQAVYYRRPEDSGSVQLWIYDLVEGGETLYDEGALTWLGWAPDSRHFVYSKGSGLQLQLGAAGETHVPLGNGRGLRWIDANQYLLLTDSADGWKLTLGSIGGAATELAGPSEKFAGYDFAD